MKKIVALVFALLMTVNTFACDAPATNYCPTCGYVWAYCKCGGGGAYYGGSSYSSGNGNVIVYGNNYGVINNAYYDYSYVNNGYDYSVDYYDNDSYTEYDNSYCLLCGLDWDTCTCYDQVDVYPVEYGGDCDYQCYSYGSCYEYDEYDESSCYYYDYSQYSESVYCEYTTQMCHWANLRDECGNVIGIVDAGDNVEICGPCADNPSRTIIYDYNTGCYGTVASCYVYGSSDYYYEHPAEWCGNIGDNSFTYENCGYDCLYDEYDTWAADDWQWIAQNGCGYDAQYDCGYGYLYEDCDYEYDECYYEDDYEDDGFCYAWYCNGRLCNENISVNIDLSNATINIYSGNSIILSGECDCSGLTCGEYTYCADYEAYCGGYGASLPSGCPMSVCE